MAKLIKILGTAFRVVVVLAKDLALLAAWYAANRQDVLKFMGQIQFGVEEIKSAIETPDPAVIPFDPTLPTK